MLLSEQYNNRMEMMFNHIYWMSRILVVVFAAECAIRYGDWWLRLWQHKFRDELFPLVPGIVITNACFVGILITSYIWEYGQPLLSPSWKYRMIFYVGVTAGTILKLIPAWRIAYGWSGIRMTWQIALRVIIALLIPFVLP